MEISKLIKRSDFVRLSQSATAVKTPAFVVLFEKNDLNMVRYGVTASKRVGNAVVRNRAKRRMRAVFDDVIRLNENFKTPTGFDMNIVARAYILDRHYDRMVKELRQAVESIAV